MGQLIKINFNNLDNKKDKNYKNKLVRIRDEIEDYLNLVSRNENDSTVEEKNQQNVDGAEDGAEDSSEEDKPTKK